MFEDLGRGKAVIEIMDWIIELIIRKHRRWGIYQVKRRQQYMLFGLDQ